MTIYPDHHYASPQQVIQWAGKAGRIVVQSQVTDEQPRQFRITKQEAVSMARTYAPETKIRATLSGTGTLYIG